MQRHAARAVLPWTTGPMVHMAGLRKLTARDSAPTAWGGKQKGEGGGGAEQQGRDLADSSLLQPEPAGYARSPRNRGEIHMLSMASLARRTSRWRFERPTRTLGR